MSALHLQRTRYRTQLTNQRSTAVNRVQKVLEDANIKLPSVVSSIQGVSTHVRPHHRFMLAELLTHMDGLNQKLAHLNERIKQQATPHEALIKRLDEIPGVGRHTAAILLAEIGCNVDPFPFEKHLASWACLCPGHNISANKRRTGARKEQKWLRAALAEAA